jgi:phage-related protein (TIGR01555 family)
VCGCKSVRDKAASQIFTLDILSQMELEKAYRGDWLARKIVDIPAFDSCRAWRSWQADQDQIEKLEEAERAFGIQRKVMDAMVKARLYGGAAIVLGVKKQKFEDELDIDKVGEGDLAFAHVITKWMIAPGPLVRDITSPWFGEPEYYQRSNTPITGPIGGVAPLETGVFGKEAGSMLNIHPSRVVRIIGNDYPNMEISPDAWGDSVLQTVVDAIKDAGLVGQSIAALTAKANVDVIKIPGLTQMLSTDKGTTALVSRFSQSNAAKSVVNSLLIDSAEEWNQLQVTFSGLPQVSAGCRSPAARICQNKQERWESGHCTRQAPHHYLR